MGLVIKTVKVPTVHSSSLLVTPHEVRSQHTLEHLTLYSSSTSILFSKVLNGDCTARHLGSCPYDPQTRKSLSCLEKKGNSCFCCFAPHTFASFQFCLKNVLRVKCKQSYQKRTPRQPQRDGGEAYLERKRSCLLLFKFDPF